MSSMYSGDHGDGVSTRVMSTKSIGQAIQWTREWIANDIDRSSASSAGSSLSSRSSKHDDLDLDSLFKRLDKYTAEMQEVEQRLKRARSNSEKSDGINIKRFSFEDGGTQEEDKGSTPSRSPRSSSSASQQRRSLNGRADKGKRSVSTCLPKSANGSSRASSRHTSPGRSPPKEAPVVDDEASKDVLNVADKHSEPQEEPENPDNPPRRVFGDWGVWAEQKFQSSQSVQERSSSRYSERAESMRGTPSHNFLWKRMSPSPPLKDMRRTPTLRKARGSDPIAESSAQSAHDNHEDSEDDEPGPSVPASWVLPPRSSSKRTMSDEKLPPRISSRKVISDQLVQDQENIPPRPAPRRRMTTGEGRPSIRNGGFWSNQSAALFDDGDVPPVPALSASNSTLTMTPPLTPLTIGGPTEDQLRRELETFSIQDGAEALEHRYKKRRPPMLNLLDSDDDKDELTPSATPVEPDHSSVLSGDDDRSLRPRPRRRKSIFSIFQRKSPVEKLIDMYFDDEPEEKPISRRRSTWSRKGSPVQEKMPKSPAIPPQFQAHGKQTSV
ncbi:hypothetical protein H2200_001235 [Cladophialophora chaetospira]|uniref:Uncharacterized protein n=1 Tax=Cladophialophora chaetospira TaxID=386627 RepID=A0AA39CNV6_9EURO|nr:hypothetical protein H2200_001235 [Cladophialophora chaetospira]